MEAHVPLPDPGRNDHWDPAPMRCPVCRNILDSVHPASRKDGRLEGRCPTHGQVVATQSPNSGME